MSEPRGWQPEFVPTFSASTGSVTLDALLYAVRDTIRASGIKYGIAECEIMEDGSPPPRCGNVFAAVHGGRVQDGPANDNNLYEVCSFSVTVTMRVVISLDRVGDQLIARNLVRIPEGVKQGFNARIEQLRGLLHMNWAMTVLQAQVPNSANDNIAAWTSGTVYGFTEPARYRGAEIPVVVAGDWFKAKPDAIGMGVKAEMRFGGAKRFQPQTAAIGSFA